MKNGFTITGAILGVLGAALATGCGSGDETSLGGEATGDESGAITALGPALVNGCSYAQSFALGSPQAIDWVANNYDNLSNVQMQLSTSDAAGGQTRIAQNAQAASNQMLQAVNKASSTFASNQNVANAFNTAATMNNQTTMRSLASAQNAWNAVNGLDSTFQDVNRFHHDDAIAQGSQYANGAQSNLAYGNKLSSGQSFANQAASRYGASAAQNATNANAYDYGANAAQHAGAASQYADGATSAMNANGTAAGQNGYGVGANNAYRSGIGALGGAAPALGGIGSFGALGQNVTTANGTNAYSATNGANTAQRAQAAGQAVNDATATQTSRNAGQIAAGSNAAQSAQNQIASNNAANAAQQAYDTGTNAFRTSASGMQSTAVHDNSDATTAVRNTAINRVTQSGQTAALNETTSTIGNTASSQMAGQNALSSVQNASSAWQGQNAFQATSQNTLGYDNLAQYQSRNMVLQVTGVTTSNNAALKLFTGWGPSVTAANFGIAAPACVR